MIIDRDILTQADHLFSHQIKEEGKPVTDQKNSGRCWMFAGLNVMRIPFIVSNLCSLPNAYIQSTKEKYKLESFEFSQSYLFFFDKLEKANYFLHSIISTRHEGLDSRRVRWLLTTLISDGGQWYFPKSYII